MEGLPLKLPHKEPQNTNHPNLNRKTCYNSQVWSANEVDTLHITPLSTQGLIGGSRRLEGLPQSDSLLLRRLSP